MKKIYLLVWLALLISACGNTPKVLRYSKKLNENPASITTKSEIEKLVNINAFVLDPAAGSGKSISDLSDKGQAALINGFQAKTVNTKELIAAVASPIKEASSQGGIKGNGIWKKRVVLNIMKVDAAEANRVQNILFTLAIPDNLKDKVEFVSWDKIATETQIIDLGKITTSNVTSFSFSPEVTLAGTIEGKLAGAASNTKTFNQEKTFSGKFAGLNAAIVSKQKFQVFRQSAANENMGGNIVVELTLKSNIVKEFTTYQFNGFYNGTIVTTDPTKIAFVETVNIIPDFGLTPNVAPIDLTYQFRYRQVGKGKMTIPEYDDEVTYVDGTFTEKAKFNIFDINESSVPKTWEISDGTNSLHILKNGNLSSLVFGESMNANELLSWVVKTQNLKVADCQLYLGTKPLQTVDMKNLMVALIK